MKSLIVLLALASPVAADQFDVMKGAAHLFPDQPRLVEFENGTKPCGMGQNSSPRIAYCTSEQVIYYNQDFAIYPSAPYELAHFMGHYLQVKYGVADVALREISSRRSEEDALRGMVTRQVECLAGVLMSAGGLPFEDLRDHFDIEPFTDAHWGRDPLNNGPRVSIGLAARAQWYRTGYDAGDVAACSVGEMSADLLVAAQR